MTSRLTFFLVYATTWQKEGCLENELLSQSAVLLLHSQASKRIGACFLQFNIVCTLHCVQKTVVDETSRLIPTSSDSEYVHLRAQSILP